MSTYNYSLFAVPVGWAMSMIPHFYAANLSMSCKDMPSFDNASPRSFIDRVRRLEKQTPTTKRYLRAEAAQQNGHENLPLFAAALIVANYAGLSKSELNWTAGAYLASRVVYNLLYICTDSPKLANIRSVVFVYGVYQCLAAFVKAGLLLNKRL